MQVDPEEPDGFWMVVSITVIFGAIVYAIAYAFSL